MRGSPSRQRLFAFERNVVVRAGAGTGKTEALATVYLHLVSGLASPTVWPRTGVAPERIVALTFTEKAAREMRERITEAVTLLTIERLPRALESLDAAERANAATQWGATRGVSAAVAARVLSLADSAAAAGRPLPSPELWQRIAWSLGSAHIGTFHSFAAGLLRRAAVDLDLDPAFRVIEREDADRLLRVAALGALADAAQRDVNAVVELMAAGGGLGERGDQGLVTLVARLVHALDEDGLRADAVGVTSAVDATDARPYIVADTLLRFAEACREVPALRDDGTAQRMHDLARRIEGLAPAVTAEAALERARWLRDYVKGRNALPPRNRTRKIETIAEEARIAVHALFQDAVSVVSVHLAEAARAITADAQRRYERAKRARAALDYADLMRLARDGLRDRVSLRRECKARYDAMLVDEFQDTNRVQRDLLYLLRERRDSERLLAPSQSLSASDLESTGLLVVGDAKQSIYAFRGAEVAVFLSTEQELGDAGGEGLELTESFRALDGVLAALNPVAESLLTGTHAEGLYDRARDTLVATAGDGEGPRVELALVEAEQADALRRAEADLIAQRITELATASNPKPGWRPPRMDEIAILVPSWSHLEPIKRALQARAVPFAVRGGPGFWDRREVDDLLVLLRFVAQPSDRLALASLLRGPIVGLSDAGLAHLFAEATGLDDMLDPPGSLRASLDADDRARLDEARPSLRRLVRFGPTLGPCGVLRQCLAERGYAAVLARLPFGAQRVANVDKLVGIAAAAEERGGDEADLAGFVRYVDRMRDAAQRESEADLDHALTGSVNVLSIHAAKGLEWPVVFVAQTSHRRPPRVDRVLLDDRGRFVALPGGVDVPDNFRALRARAHAAEDDDARRLLYVALTRARDLLVVTGPDGDGDGEWSRLRAALANEVPFRVRLLRASPQGTGAPPVNVRARAEAPVDDPMRVQGTAPGPPPRRRLAVAASSLQDFAWCPRRFQVLHDLGLREHTGASAEAAAAGALARAVILRAAPDLLVRDADEAVARHCAATGERVLGTSSDIARTMVRRFAAMPLATTLATQDDLVLGRGLPWALRLSEDGIEVTLTGTADLVLRGEALARDGVVVAQLAVHAERDEAVLPGADPQLELLIARLALARRFAESGTAVPVHAVVITLSDDHRRGVDVLHTLDLDVIEGRALEAARSLLAARDAARWEPRPRYLCNGLRCGFVPRCHG